MFWSIFCGLYTGIAKSLKGCSCMLTKLCWDASSISRVCICLVWSLFSTCAPCRASVFCDTCTCTSVIWQENRVKVSARKDQKLVAIALLCTLYYLIFMPPFEVFCILHCYLFIVAPHFLHYLRQVLTFRGVNIHLHAWLRDLVSQLHHLLQNRNEDRVSNNMVDMQIWN